MKTDITVREYIKGKDLNAGLDLRNQIFPSITVSDWEKGGPKTASIAYHGEQVVGFIPLAFRKFKIGSEKCIDTVFENAVGTKENYRGRGIGTKMINAAKDFLKERVDSLFVYRGGERSTGYNFYAKTGHHDLHYLRDFEKTEVKNIHCAEIEITSNIKESLKWGEKMLDIFEDTYSSYGGYPPRTTDYWSNIFSSQIFKAIPQEINILWYKDLKKILGYLITGIKSREGQKDSKLYLLELAAKNGDCVIAEKLLEGAVSFAASKKLESVKTRIGDEGPFVSVYKKLGFTGGLRLMNIMGQPLTAKKFINRIWGDSFNLPGMKLDVWTPEENFTLLNPSGRSFKHVTLEMKQETLVRWLMGRINFRGRFNEGTITAVNIDNKIIDMLSKTIPFTPWVYHHLDYI